MKNKSRLSNSTQSFLKVEFYIVALFVLGLLVLGVVVFKTQMGDSFNTRSQAAKSRELTPGDDPLSLQEDLDKSLVNDEPVTLDAIDNLE